MIKHLFNKNNRRWLPALLLASLVGLFPSCKKDILEGQPEWLGNSIYERLQEGIVVNGQLQSFNYMLRLIDDLDQTEVLSHTGSKTMFVATDEAFEEWFKNNSWGVRNYDQLSSNQKTMLMNNAMINNAYLLELMSNVAGNPPQGGLCMRRPTAATIYDTVYTVTPENMPVDAMLDEDLDVWKRFRENNKSIKIFKDNTVAPMIHFLPRFMAKNKITDSDLSKLTNGSSNSIADSWINGRKVISQEQTCKNGYIYVVDGVIEPSRNMAQIIEQNPSTQLWAKMMNRFAVPFYDYENSREYNRINNTNDSIYSLKYFSDFTLKINRSAGILMHPYVDNDTLVVPGRLAFDPGWNTYMYRNPMGYDAHYDAGAMIVPDDSAVMRWWNGAGAGLQAEYHELDSLPIATLAVLMRVHMLPSFIESVPSKFNTIVDDAKVTLGITANDVTRCYMGCNGVVYVSSSVFPPSEFRSVIYPALASQSLMGVIYNAVKEYDFGPFLNSMESDFTMILPNNTGASINPNNTEKKYMQYLDPCTYGLTEQVLYEFYFDQKSQKIKADRYIVTIDEKGNPVWDGTSKSKITTTLTENELKNRLSDMVNNLIIIGNLNTTQKFYKTKAGSMIYVDYNGLDNVRLGGGYQYNLGRDIVPIKYYNMKEGTKGNGVSFATMEIPMTSSLSVYEVLKGHAKRDDECTNASDSAFRAFYELLTLDKSSSALTQSQDGSYYCANQENDNKNLSLFDNYNYTVYVPTNAAIRKLIQEGILPTWDDYNNTTDKDEQKFIADRIHSFLRYHIQDNSVLIGGEEFAATDYESSKLNDATRRFYSIKVTNNNGSLTLVDRMKNTRKVETQNDLYNIICREYWMKASGTGTAVRKSRELVSSSHAVVHQIDDVLIYADEMQKDWKSVMRGF